MKTLEDFDNMTAPQLKGILQSLSVAIPANAKKADLVRLAFDTQQATEEEQETQEPPADPNKPIDTEETFKARLQEIADHYDGEIEETEEEKDGAAVYVVNDMAGDEVARGTFAELSAYVQSQNQVQAGDAETPGLTDVPLSEDLDDTSSPAIADEDALKEIEDGLKALAPLGLRYSIDGSVVKLEYQSKVVSTTLNQPAFRVVRTAESLCNFR